MLILAGTRTVITPRVPDTLAMLVRRARSMREGGSRGGQPDFAQTLVACKIERLPRRGSSAAVTGQPGSVIDAVLAGAFVALGQRRVDNRISATLIVLIVGKSSSSGVPQCPKSV